MKAAGAQMVPSPRCPELAPGIGFGTRQRCPLDAGHDGPHGSNQLGWWNTPRPDRPGNSRDLYELSTTGMLWLINRVVFHPRGFALAFDVKDGAVLGWALQGNGSEPVRFTDDRDNINFDLAEAFLAQHRRQS